jgi:hypothetical protein
MRRSETYAKLPLADLLESVAGQHGEQPPDRFGLIRVSRRIHMGVVLWTRPLNVVVTVETWMQRSSGLFG